MFSLQAAAFELAIDSVPAVEAVQSNANTWP